MPRTTAVRKYGKQHQKKAKSDRLFAELPEAPAVKEDSDDVDAEIEKGGEGERINLSDGNDQGKEHSCETDELAEKITALELQDKKNENKASTRKPAAVEKKTCGKPRRKRHGPEPEPEPVLEVETVTAHNLEPEPLKTPDRQKLVLKLERPLDKSHETDPIKVRDTAKQDGRKVEENQEIKTLESGLRVLSWSEVCPPGDEIAKFAEASFAEVYRVTNERGTSIIKVIRMAPYPIKAQTKAQQNSGLVDEEPHTEADLMGELRISELLADIPGFVVYKERYIVQGKACKELLHTHQTFHKRLKRQDPDRLQFYPSPSRYLDGTRFLVIELGDAGTAVEDMDLVAADQLWDVYFHVAIALARAEAHIEFEHRDLHEGNLCIRQANSPVPPDQRTTTSNFGHSGLEITILDYGLSRAKPPPTLTPNGPRDSLPIAYDMERDLSIFTSEHAPQCQVYRQMRSYLLRGDRLCLPPDNHNKPYAAVTYDGGRPISWACYTPYTNVLWLAYIYEYLISNFRGPKKELNAFRRATGEFWIYLDPTRELESDDDDDDNDRDGEGEGGAQGFSSASDIVMYAVECGWIDKTQLTGGRPEIEQSIISSPLARHPNRRRSGREGVGDLSVALANLEVEVEETSMRRSPRRHQQRR